MIAIVYSQGHKPIGTCESEVGLIHGEDDHVEPEHEDQEDGGELGEVAHQVAEDDGPRP